MKEPKQIPAREITEPAIYFNRRTFMRAGIVAASAIATGLVYRRLNPVATGTIDTPLIKGLTTHPAAMANVTGFPASDPATSLQDITHYNNFYEFSTDKERVAPAAARFETKGWQVSVEGLVRKPKSFDLDDLLKISPPEERIYRMRCVEGMVHGDSMGRFSAVQTSRAGRAAQRCEVCRFRDTAGSQAHAGTAERCARLALC